ncbi:hypothetical protein J0H58_16515 [bacterium]|nr:hypothetical protein [bacterium]
MESLQSWADWLSRQNEGFRVEMWKAHGIAGLTRQIERTVELLRWVAENLES